MRRAARCFALVSVGASVWIGHAIAGVNEWTPLGPYGGDGTPRYVHALAAAPNTPFLYAAADEGVYRSDDGGAHWLARNDGLADSRGLLSIAVDPDSPSTLYAGAFAGLFKSTDAGASWAHIWSAEVVYTVVLDPVSPATLYAGTGPMNLDDVSSIFKSTDGGTTWTRVLATSDYYGFVSIAIDPVSSANVYAGSYRGQFFRSADAGATWSEVTGYWDGRIHMAIDPSSPSTLYASSAQTVVPIGPGVGNVLKSTDSGRTWSLLPGIPGINVASVALDPRSPSHVYAGVDGVVYESTDGGQSWTGLGDVSVPIYAEALLFDLTRPSHLYVASGVVYDISIVRAGPCVPDATTLCLNDGRFRVDVGWQRTPLGSSQPGHAMPVTPDSGYFWFLDPDNVELMIKVLDGTSVNGFFWVFYGALTNLGYTITVTDTLTGESRSYVNEPGHMASEADTAAFPGPDAGLENQVTAFSGSVTAAGPEAATEGCQPDPHTLCLNDGRFQVRAAWQLTPAGPLGAAQIVPLTGDTGAFWFFDSANIELVVKVLDGRPVDGHFWVFYGALSDLDYTITVTDTVTGAVRSYHNARGTLGSVADTSAF